MNRALVFTLVLLKISTYSSAQSSTPLVIDSIHTNNGATIGKSLKAESLTIQKGATFLGSVGVENGLQIKGGFNLNSGILTVGNKVGDSNFNLQYSNGATSRALFSFIKGNSTNTLDNLIDGYISKEASGPMSLVNNKAESILFGTDATTRLTIGGNGNIGIGAAPTTDKLNVAGTVLLNGNVGIGAASAGEKLSVAGNTKLNGNVGIGTTPTSDILAVTGNTNLNGNVGIGTAPTTNRLTVTGNTNLNGNVGIGTAPTTDRLTVTGNTNLNGKVAVTGTTTFGTLLPREAGTGYTTLPIEKLNVGGNIRVSAVNPKIHLEGNSSSSFPEVIFSGYEASSGKYRPEYTKLSGYGGLTISTWGFLKSLAKGTTRNTISKNLHVYQADDWSGYAAVGAIGLYGGASYANAIDFISNTRIKIQPNDYTGGLVMGYSAIDPTQIDLGVAASIKSQYMGTNITSAGEHKFDMVFGINSDGTGGKTYEPVERMRIKDNGQVNIGNSLAIGTTALPQGYSLGVKGKIIAEEVNIALHANWPDYVFDKNYKLPPLSNVEQFIKENGHLPEIPKAADIEKNGIEVGAMNTKLLQKIEELTLYLINQQKQIEELKKEVSELKKQ